MKNAFKDMGITDWDAWMKEHHIYIPTPKEVEEANMRNLVKVRTIEKMCKTAKINLEAYRKKVKESEKLEVEESSR